MKLHKLISRTVLATALLGATFSGLVAGNNASADTTNSRDSNSSINVTNGPLSLESVPNFQFADRANTNNNTVGLRSGGKLRVVDYRNSYSPNDDSYKSGRWKLNVAINGLQNQNIYDNNNWEIDFNQTSSETNLMNNDSTKDLASGTPINSQQIFPNVSNNNSKDIVTNGKWGITQVDYNGDQAQMKVPNVSPGNNYNATMNWNLSTTFSGNDNVGSST